MNLNYYTCKDRQNNVTRYYRMSDDKLIGAKFINTQAIPGSKIVTYTMFDNYFNDFFPVSKETFTILLHNI